MNLSDLNLYTIQTVDTLFFRDGRPFTSGENSWADGIFPPMPSTYFGAICTALITENPELLNELKKAGSIENLDNGNPLKELEIKHIFYATKNIAFQPAPFDLVKLKSPDDKNKDISLMTLSKDRHLLTPYPLEYCFYHNEKVESVTNGLLSLGSLKKYLNNKLKVPCKINEISDFVLTEPKVGNQRQNESGATQEGMLYRTGMFRLKDFYPVLALNKKPKNICRTENNEKTTIQLGGEGKTAIINPSSLDNEIFNYTLPEIEAKQCKVVLSTPAVFKNGWFPGWIDKNDFTGEWNGVKLKLIAAITGSYINAGGWDVLNNRPKILRRAVPAGAVFVFETIDGITQNFNQLFNYGNPFCDNFGDISYNKQGFGRFFIAF